MPALDFDGRSVELNDRNESAAANTYGGLASSTESRPSMADLAVISSLSPLDALYKETRAQRKAVESSEPPSSEQPQTMGQDDHDVARIPIQECQEVLKESSNIVHAPLERTSSKRVAAQLERNASTASSTRNDQIRESVVTMGSANGDPFHYDSIESASESPSAPTFSAGAEDEPVDPYLSRIPSVIHPRSYAQGGSLSPAARAVGSPASTFDERFQDCLETPGSSKATSPSLSQGSASLNGRMSPSLSRTPSQTYARNYSRPLEPGSRTTRSDSTASSLAGPSSSLGHSSSSHAISLTSSWDHRNMYEFKRQEALEDDFRTSVNRAERATQADERPLPRPPSALPGPQASGTNTSPSKKTWSFFKRRSQDSKDQQASSRFSAASTVRDQKRTTVTPQKAGPASHFSIDRPFSQASLSVFSFDGASRTDPTRPAARTMHKATASLRKAPQLDDKSVQFLTRDRSRLLDLDNPQTPEEFLQAGIEEHESGDLSRAAYLFAKSAAGDPPCAGGMLMYGLTLRHGWGCPVDAELGFRYIQSAAEFISEDLDRAVAGGRVVKNSGLDARAVRNELVLALHEIGTSLRFGWGVPKDKKAAVSYFKLAADLGDVDAQQDLAFCYANGKGCKKSMKLAAKYYRLAIAQGAPSFGLSWVFKPKWDE